MKEFAVNRRWFSMKATETEAEISIFDEIGSWGVTVADFKKELDSVKGAASIKLLINSPGGSVFDGMAIYNLLAPMKEKITVHVLGLAASIASILALAGSRMLMGEGTYFMIHDPWAIAMGTARDFRKTADLLDSISTNLADIYTARSTYTGEEIAQLMSEETWLTAQEAVDAGFADEIVKNAASIAALACDITKFGFQKMPQDLIKRISKKNNPPSTARDLERTLRDAGFSRSVAAGIVAEGFSAVSTTGGLEQQGSGNEPGDAGAAAAEPDEPISETKPEGGASRRKTRARIREMALATSDILKE